MSAREKVIHVRVSDDEYEQINVQAKAVGLTASGYMRSCTVANTTNAANATGNSAFAVVSPPGVYSMSTNVTPDVAQLASRVASLEATVESSLADAIQRGQGHLAKPSKPTSKS